MTMNGIYIDDDASAKQWAARLESEDLKVTLLEPAELISLADEVMAKKPAVVILDYRLDEHKGTSGRAVTYRAAPVAQHMRDKTGSTEQPDFPIVLISSEDKIRKLYRPEKTAHDLFDWKFIKQNVSDSERPAKILRGLANGYAQLREACGNFNQLSLFGLEGEGDAYLIDFQELTEALADAEYPHIAARYLLNFVIRRQGLLIDRDTLYARLGTAPPADGALERLNEWMGPARYTGVFSECCERWWGALVEARISELLEGPVAQFTAASRARRLSEVFHCEFHSAKDRWTGSIDFSPVFACASCHCPTPLKHSLACLSTRLPAFVQRPRVCFMCIQTDQLQEHPLTLEEGHELRFGAEEERIADRIRMGQVQPEAS
jgi:hypothetical protein